MAKKILLIGAGGHCRSVLDSLLKLKLFSEIGIIEKNNVQNENLLNIPILGCDEDLSQLYKSGYEYAFITVGNLALRKKLYNLILNIGFKIPIIIDSSAIVSKFSQIDKGTFIGKRAIINSNTIIGENVIINSGAIIEHDCIINSFSHIAPGAVLCGGVEIGENTHIGANSTIREGIKVGNNSMIGMSSVVTKDIDSCQLAFGSPCREVKTI